MSGFSHVFRPAVLAGHTLRNRGGFGAHTTNMAEDGLPGARHIAYYEERAIGGAAMIVVERGTMKHRRSFSVAGSQSQ